MGFPDSAGTNEEHVVVAAQKCPLRELQETHFGNARDQRKIKVLQALLIREGSGFEPLAQVLLVALQRYGMILADNGSPWYVTGAPATGWNDDDLHQLQQITGKDFEVVDTTNLRNG